MPEQSFELLVELSRDDDPRTRVMAIAGLARVADPRGFAPVLVALFDPVDEVRAAAATALGVFGDDRAFEALVEGLRDPNERVAANCAWALGQIIVPRSLDQLLETAADAEAPAVVRVAAVTAIGERAVLPTSDIADNPALTERARVTLINALDEDEDELRAASVWTLGHLPADKQTVELVIECLDDEYEWVVRYAVEALAQFKDLSAVEPLEELADVTEEDELRNLIYRALDMIH